MKTTCGKLLALVIVGSLSFCSCKAMPQRVAATPKQSAEAAPLVSPGNPTGNPIVLAQHTSPALPLSAYTGDPSQGYHGGHSAHCPHCSPGAAEPFHFSCQAEELQWAPDGIELPWPHGSTADVECPLNQMRFINQVRL